MIALLFVSNLHAEMFHRVDGRVLEIKPFENQFSIEFIHPVSGEEIKKEFTVSEQAGFKYVKKLGDLKSGDLVSVDYLETSKPATATYIILIPLQHAYVTREELAKALLTIHSNKK